MKVSIPKRLLEHLTFDPVRGEYAMLVCNSPIGRTPLQVVKPGPVRYRVEIRPDGYIVLFPR
ncbi:hypothetical protein BGV49_11155 [Burkholderia ubonensis]|nr:hypothetical protein BGV49_11155 [Burkholderia ubonensis]